MKSVLEYLEKKRWSTGSYHLSSYEERCQCVGERTLYAAAICLSVSSDVATVWPVVEITSKRPHGTEVTLINSDGAPLSQWLITNGTFLTTNTAK